MQRTMGFHALELLVQKYRKPIMNDIIDILRRCIYNIGINEEFLFNFILFLIIYKGVSSTNKFSLFLLINQCTSERFFQ